MRPEFGGLSSGAFVESVPNFTVIESVYGRFVVNRHCAYQAEALIKTGRPHIEPELRVLQTIAGLLPPGSVTLDAGANIGLVCVPLAQFVKASGGSVLAFEAQRMLYYALCGTTALNDLANLRVYNLALGREMGRITVPAVNYAEPADYGEVSLVNPGAAPGEDVDMVSIDSLGLDRLDLLKVDVEGMEIDVIQGAAGTIEDFRPWCWVEYWKTGVEPIKECFAGGGYRFFRMDPLNMLCVPQEKAAASGLNTNAEEL